METIRDSNGNLQAALEAQEKGYFPVAMLSGQKVPAEAWGHWEHDVMTRESIYERWEGTRNGIALLCRNLIVFDVDDKNLLDYVVEQAGLQRAPICRTPGNGFHVHARPRRGVDLSRKIKVKKQSVDLLAQNSLSIIPFSTNEIGTPYAWLGEGLPEYRALPVAKISWTRERTRKCLSVPMPTAIAEVTDPHSLLSRGRRYVDSFPRCIAGQSGHRTCFIASLKICSFVKKDPELAWQLLVYYSATKADPPWSEGELKHKLDNALRLAR